MAQYPWREALCRQLSGQGIPWQADAPLAPLTTFRIGGPAALLVSPQNEAQLAALLAALAALARAGTPVRRYCLGRGSNTLFADAGFAGVVIHTAALCGTAPCEGGLAAGAGAPLSAVCRAAAAAGLAGLEFAYGIPGAVGGAVFMNAGAYGGEMKDVVAAVRVLDDEGRPRWVARGECGFGYRTSAFQNGADTVVCARFALCAGDSAAILARMEELAARRRARQPLQWPSAGSTFKRPQGAYAAALIEQCGLKGLRVGGAQVSEQHAGFVINTGGATCADVLALTQQVSKVVYEQTGHLLEREIRVVE